MEYDYRMARMSLQRVIEGQLEVIFAKHGFDVQRIEVGAVVRDLVAREMERINAQC